MKFGEFQRWVFRFRLNLVIYYLRQDDVNEAYTLIKDLVSLIGLHFWRGLNLKSGILFFKSAWWLFSVGQTNILTDRLMIRWTNEQTDRQIDRQTDRQTDRQVDRWTDGLMDWWKMDKWTDGQMNRQTDRPTDKQTDKKQRDRWTGGLMNKWINRQMKRFTDG